MKNFSDYQFGDYSGMREYKRNPDYFLSSFVEPESFSIDSLSNKSNFIIVGRKGTGKSSCCLRLADTKRAQGYSTTFFSFSDDLNRGDVRDAVITQALNLGDLSSGKLYDSIHDLYDFKDLWVRRVLYSLSSALAESGKKSNFINFCQSIELSEQSIAQGVGRGLTLSAPPDNGILWLKDFIERHKVKNAMPLRSFNEAAKRLLVECHAGVKHFFFFDELNVSHVDTKSDQYEVLLALVRDIIRCAAVLNDFFAENKIDVHVICCLRPEVKNRLIEREPELSKTVDSNSADLSWPYRNEVDNPLIGLLKKKLEASGATSDDIQAIIPTEVKDMDGPGRIAFPMFFLNLTWYRPRDVVRVLKVYQRTNPQSQILFEPGYDMDRFLRQYSQESTTDCFAELQVKYTKGLLDQALSRIRWARYDKGQADLESHLEPMGNRLDVREFIKDLFEAGVISNHDKGSGKTQIYSATRGDATLSPNMRVLVHRGLWRALQLRE